MYLLITYDISSDKKRRKIDKLTARMDERDSVRLYFLDKTVVKAGMSLYHSFLHSEQPGKPTLVFDLIEEFRQPVVDREIISQNIQERLVTPTKWRKGKYQIATIIDDQVLSLANESKKYKGFVARY